MNNQNTDTLLTDEDLLDGVCDDAGNEVLPSIRGRYPDVRKAKKYLGHWRKYYKVPYQLLFGQITYSKKDLIEWAKTRKKVS